MHFLKVINLNPKKKKKPIWIIPIIILLIIIITCLIIILPLYMHKNLKNTTEEDEIKSHHLTIKEVEKSNSS